MRALCWALLLLLVACGGPRTRLGSAARPDAPPAPEAGNAKPVYPLDARRRGEEGVVTLEVRVRDDGRVETAKAVGGDEPFATAAVAAAEQWRYTPATKDGRPVAATVRQNVRFQLAHAMWRLLTTAEVQQGVSAQVGVAWYDSRRECQDAALMTARAVGCVFRVRVQVATEDVAVADPHRLSDLRREPIPAGWWAVIIAPWTTTGSFAQDVPVWRWRVRASFLSRADCEEERQRNVEQMQKWYPSLSGTFNDQIRCVS